MPLEPLFDYAILDKEVCVPHPVTGLLSYGYIEPYSSRNLTLPGGDIYLRVGKHHGFSKGFGVRHIWEGHGHELVSAGCQTIEDVPAFVAGILSQGAQILCEGYQTADSTPFGHSAHADPDTCSTIIRTGSRSAATQGWHC